MVKNTTDINRSLCFCLHSRASESNNFPSEKIESSFLTAKAFTPQLTSDDSCMEKEMISLMSYTSLKDLLSHTRPGISPSSSSWIDSWEDIPIKNKLVKKAASVYLQPMSSSLLKRNNLGFFQWFTCLEFVKHIILDIFQRFFRSTLNTERVDSVFLLRQIQGKKNNTYTLRER